MTMEQENRRKRIKEAQNFLEFQYQSLHLGNWKDKYSYLWIKNDDEKCTLAFNMSLPAQLQAMAITAVQKNVLHIEHSIKKKRYTSGLKSYKMYKSSFSKG